ncbi:MAG TPA: hypothetical protein PLZ99_02805 [Parcubacteria group bacterium]|nr:hypothetical protein [Parcubacteria group bacterium]
MNRICANSLVEVLPFDENHPDGQLNKSLPKDVRDYIIGTLGGIGPFKVTEVRKSHTNKFIRVRTFDSREVCLKACYFRKANRL